MNKNEFKIEIMKDKEGIKLGLKCYGGLAIFNLDDAQFVKNFWAYGTLNIGDIKILMNFLKKMLILHEESNNATQERKK